MNRELTPLERLQLEKTRLRAVGKLQEEKLTADFHYMQENAGSILLSGISTLLFPNSKSGSSAKKQPEGTASEATANGAPQQPLGFSDYLSIAGGLAPVAWGIVQPIILTWGMKQVKKWLSRHLFTKKS